MYFQKKLKSLPEIILARKFQIIILEIIQLVIKKLKISYHLYFFVHYQHWTKVNLSKMKYFNFLDHCYFVSLVHLVNFKLFHKGFDIVLPIVKLNY